MPQRRRAAACNRPRTELVTVLDKQLLSAFRSLGVILIIAVATALIFRSWSMALIVTAGLVFHELGHILLHSKQKVFIESDKVNYIEKKLEDEADKFASDSLIPPREYKAFIKENSFYKNDIIEFAKRINIHPGIVVGRLQHDKNIDFSLQNSLRDKYSWKD